MQSSFSWKRTQRNGTTPPFKAYGSIRFLQNTMKLSLPRFAETLLSPACQTLLTRLGSYFTTLIYGGLLLWAWIPSSEKRHSGEDLLAVIFVGGFVFHTFWEAKSQYTMPYFTAILPLAMQGYRRLSHLSSRQETALMQHTAMEKIRWLAPALLLLLALLLSACLPPQYAQNLRDYLASIS